MGCDADDASTKRLIAELSEDLAELALHDPPAFRAAVADLQELLIEVRARAKS